MCYDVQVQNYDECEKDLKNGNMFVYFYVIPCWPGFWNFS